MSEPLQIADPADIRRRLDHDRPWAAFSLADLDQPYARHATWFGYENAEAIVLVYSAYDPPVLICHGPTAECEALLAEPAVVTRTRRAYLNMRPELLAAQRQFRSFEAKTMCRMVLPQSALVSREPFASVRRLGWDDLDAVQTLYAEEPPAFFLPMQLRHGVYCGAFEGPRLIAVAGTHVYSTAYEVGAIGNVYTRRDRRGRGLAADVTHAVASALLDAGISTIVLNVVVANEAARRIYSRLGFDEYCTYFEGTATR